MQTVGVLRGGPGDLHEASLQSGAAMLAALPPERYSARDVYIDKSGRWHVEGRPIAPERVLRQLDCALVPLFGDYRVERLLEHFGVPYAGAHSFAANQARHKAIAKMLASRAGLATPRFCLVTLPAEAQAITAEVVRAFHQPVSVRPVGRSVSVGVAVEGGYAPIAHAVTEYLAEGADGVLVEELVRGKGAMVGVIEGMRGESLYTLPAVEIMHPSNAYPYEAKRRGETHLYCPGRFSHVETEELARAARLMHRTLELRYHSRSDFIVSPRGIYYLETSSMPSFGANEPFVFAMDTVGLTLSELLTHLIEGALR